MSRIFALILLFSNMCYAADPVVIKITVVDTETNDRTKVIHMHGTPEKIHTDCIANATSTKSANTTNANGSQNCTTVTKQATPGYTIEKAVPQANVHAIMPNGMHVMLWCEVALRHCVALTPGEYVAEVKGNVAWVHVPKLDGSDDKIKYKSIGGW